MNKKTVLILVIAAVLILLLTIAIILSPNAKGNQLPSTEPSAAATPPVSSSPEPSSVPEATPATMEGDAPESPGHTEAPEASESPSPTESPESGDEPAETPAPSAPVSSPAPTASPDSDQSGSVEFPFPDINEEEAPGRDEMDAAEKQSRIDELIARVYALRDHYTGQLASIEAGGIAEYRALPEEEKTESRKKNIALSCADRAYALEGECDSQMDDICRELGLLIIDVGGDMDLVNEVRYAYASEKASVKNSYFSRYSEYLG